MDVSWKSLFIFQLIGECHCWWTNESPRARVAKFYGRLRLIRSVLRASKFSVLKLTEIVILWVYYPIPFGFSSIRHFLGITFQRLTYFVWLRITDEGSVPEMRIWSILLIKSDLKWCIHLSRSLFSYWKQSKWHLCLHFDCTCVQFTSWSNRIKTYIISERSNL